MKVVLDTNVLISALISPHNPPDLILQSWLAGTANARHLLQATLPGFTNHR